MVQSEQDLNTLVSLISENVTKPLQQEIHSLKQELENIRNDQKVTRQIMNADRVFNHYDYILASLRTKKTITVAFFVIDNTVWKYDKLYRKMIEDDYFEPIIFICPQGQPGDETFDCPLNVEKLMRTYDYFKDNAYDYNVVNTYNEENGSFLDIDQHYSIDLVFFEVPYGFTQPKYFIHYWSQRALTCYSFYGLVHEAAIKWFYDIPFHQKVWKMFLESDLHRQLSVASSSVDSYNTEVVGYCFSDELLDKTKTYENHWKTTGLKRIIWAPHHYQSVYNFSCFKKYAEFMLQLVDNYKDKIEIAFRPHPVLLYSLYNDPEWGKEKADAYYEKWNQFDNGQRMDGDYLDYFFTSDGMILDSMSFMSEYMYTTKPSLYTVRKGTTSESFNTYGKAVFDLLYKGYEKEDIINFVDNIVNDGDDPRKDARQEFLAKNLHNSKSGSVSQDIIDYLKKQLQPR